MNLDGLDLDISVTKSSDDPLEFEVSTWNLSEASWRKIDEGDQCRIELGWADGEIATVCFGEITSTKPEMDGGDLRYQIKGIDESEGATYARPDEDWGQKSWVNTSPDEIASDIFQSCGLTAAVEPVGGNIQGVWSATPDKRARDLVDELLEYAVEISGEAWEWYAEQGRGYFQPRNQETVDAPELSYDSSLVSINEASSEDDDAELELDFETMLDPRIRKGAAVYVDVDQHRGGYRVDSFEFSSDTTSGTHIVNGTLIPIDADYSVA
ncbi:hypothetical protein [Natrialba magadii]|uniref:hypothetical protein n=1 Tax=Natrialba magadii TaxID=13769 RepID=UPI000B06D6C4|nr:hypothetical protein [Natrialba magadii]